ncbi:transglutaminase domain-containing protein [bacterium]|nr:transglutaminase domain-containing protein [bacterium]
MSRFNSFLFLVLLLSFLFTVSSITIADNQYKASDRKELPGITVDPEELHSQFEYELSLQDQSFDRSNIIFADDNSDYIVKTSVFYELTSKQESAIERVPAWMQMDFIDAMRRLGNDGDQYADLLLSVDESLWWDEVAFIISHSDIGLLQSSSFDPELIIRNVELVYLLDKDLQYVEIVDHGTPGVDKDFYSTTKYRIKEGEEFSWYEIDKDVYYWFIVHPKMSDENPSWSSAPSDRSATYGYFWREYLYYNPSEEFDYQKYYLLNNPNVISQEDVNDWGYSAQGYLKDFTSENPEKIITDPNGEPVYVEYPYGLGTIFATTMPLEEAYVNGNKKLLENTLSYCNCEKTLPTNALIAIIKDRDPFGSKTCEEALSNLGYGFDVYTSSDLADGAIAFSDYSKVIIPSGQTKEFYQTLSENAGDIQSWVDYYNRTFEFHGAVENAEDDWAGLVMPGKFTCSSQFENLTDYVTLNKYPLLKDFLSGVTIYWDGETAAPPSWRLVLPESNVLDVVGNWVSRLLPYRAHDNRPNQPNQICFEHNGNCGEIQDLLCAASRTALVPNQPINNYTWDHVWNEFWSPKDAEWKPYQVDWNGSQTSINLYSLGYDKDHGGSKELACVTGSRGDGFEEDVIPRYTDYADLHVTVVDKFNNPVDRALITIMVPLNGGPDAAAKYSGMYAVTNSEGKAYIAVGNNRSIWAKVASPKGSINNPVKVITNSVAGESYTYEFKLSGIMPDHLNINEKDFTPSDKDKYYLRINYEAEYEKFYGGPSAQISTGYALKSYPGQIDFFIIDKEFSPGNPFEGYLYNPDSGSGTIDFTLTDVPYYLIFANPEVNQAVQFINADIDLYENAGKIWVKRKNFDISDLVLPQKTMELKFNDLGSPPIVMYGGFGNTNLSSVNGGLLMVNALVYDSEGQDNIDKVELYLGGKSTGITLDIIGDWSIADLYSISINIPPNTIPAGKYIIEIGATDKQGNISTLWPYLHTYKGETKDNSTFKNSAQNYLPEKNFLKELSSVAFCGFEDTILSDVGGDLKIAAIISSGNENIEKLELGFNGKPIDLNFTETEEAGTYSFKVDDLVGAQPEVNYLFEIYAHLKGGNKEIIFPYLQIE